MITVYKANVNQVDAESYKKFTESLNLYSLICPKCKHHDFQKHGYYTRKVKYRKHSVTLRILRVKCMSCKSTHAVLLYFEYIKLDRDKSTFKSHRDFSSEKEITFKHL